MDDNLIRRARKMSSANHLYDVEQDVERAIHHSQVNPDQLRNKTIFITGGTGFFGTWFLSVLVSIKRSLGGALKIYALSRAPEKFAETAPGKDLDRDVIFLKGDICNFDFTSYNDITHVVHMATTSAKETYLGEDSINKLDMLYRGTSNLLEKCPSKFESVLFTSSGVAYGLIEDGDRISETDQGVFDPLDRNAALGLGKLVAESLVSLYASKRKFNFSIARCFSFAGQYLPMDLHYAFGNFVANALAEEVISIKGDGLDRRSYLYIGDAVAWLLRLLVEPKNGIFNVGSENGLEVRELAERIDKQLSKPLGTKVQNSDAGVGNFRRLEYIPSTEKIRTAYPGLKEWTALDEIIGKMLVVK